MTFDTHQTSKTWKAVLRSLKHSSNQNHSTLSTGVSQALQTSLAVRAHDAIHLVKVRDIRRIEASGNYCCIHLNNGNKVTVSKTLKVLVDAIDPRLFVRIHSSHLIAVNAIEKIMKDRLVINDGTELPVARLRRADLMELISSIAQTI